MTRKAPRQGREILSSAKALVGSSYPVGMCQQWCRLRAGTPASGGSAHAAWSNAQKKVATTDPAKIPLGALTYYVGGRYGHVAIYAGGGQVISTDFPSNGKVGYTDAKTGPLRRWGHSLRGYIVVDGNGYDLLGTESPTDDPRWTDILTAVDRLIAA